MPSSPRLRRVVSLSEKPMPFMTILSNCRDLLVKLNTTHLPPISKYLLLSALRQGYTEGTQELEAYRPEGLLDIPALDNACSIDSQCQCDS